MDNFLENGTVLPSGLLNSTSSFAMAAFNKTYRNTALRAGIIAKAYSVNDDGNLLGLTTEYDVLVFEQYEDKGSSIVTYKNCMSAEGMGSIPDFFEKSLRIRDNSTNVDAPINTIDQNGAIVLILCLDGVTEKAIIVSSLTHPERPTTLLSTDPYLEGEYNGANLKIDTDGSITATFKGATDNDGEQVDDTQGNTVFSVETDGSVQLQHDSITFRLDRNGTATLTTNADTNLNVTGNINITVQGNAVVQCNDVSVNAQGKADIQIGADATIQVGGDAKATISGKLIAKASEIDLNGTAGKILTTATDPVVDTIFGTPTVGVPTVKAG